MDELGIGEASIAENGTAGLEGLDDLIGLVAGEREAGGGGVYFHCTAKGLLCARCHAATNQYFQISIPCSLMYIDDCHSQEGITAVETYLSASSRIITLCRPGGRVTFFCAKALIRFRTTSIPVFF